MHTKSHEIKFRWFNNYGVYYLHDNDRERNKTMYVKNAKHVFKSTHLRLLIDKCTQQCKLKNGEERLQVLSLVEFQLCAVEVVEGHLHNFIHKSQ